MTLTDNLRLGVPSTERLRLLEVFSRSFPQCGPRPLSPMRLGICSGLLAASTLAVLPPFLRRGYYNSLNGKRRRWAAAGFVQQASFMAAGTLLETAYLNHVSPPPTLAQIVGKTVTNDGIFDVLDVPLKLTGTGFLDTATNTYKFDGNAIVQTLPNLNSEGLRNDITINRISLIEYRFDGGPWQTLSQHHNSYSADLNLSIPVIDNATTIEIRGSR